MNDNKNRKLQEEVDYLNDCLKYEGITNERYIIFKGKIIKLVKRSKECL